MTWAERLRSGQWYWAYVLVAGPSLIRLIAYPDSGWDTFWLVMIVVTACWPFMWALLQLLSVPLRVGQHRLRRHLPNASLITITELRTYPVDSPDPDVTPVLGSWKDMRPKNAALGPDRLEFWSGESTPRELFTIRRGEIVDVRTRRYFNGISRVTAIEVIVETEGGLSITSFVPSHPIGRHVNDRSVRILHERIAVWWRREGVRAEQVVRRNAPRFP